MAPHTWALALALLLAAAACAAAAPAPAPAARFAWVDAAQRTAPGAQLQVLSCSDTCAAAKPFPGARAVNGGSSNTALCKVWLGGRWYVGSQFKPQRCSFFMAPPFGQYSQRVYDAVASPSAPFKCGCISAGAPASVWQAGGSLAASRGAVCKVGSVADRRLGFVAGLYCVTPGETQELAKRGTSALVIDGRLVY